jgi:hypothetical protein
LHLVVEMLNLVMALIFCFIILSHHALFFNHISKSCLKVNEERLSSLNSEKCLIMWTCFLPCLAAYWGHAQRCSEFCFQRSDFAVHSSNHAVVSRTRTSGFRIAWDLVSWNPHTSLSVGKKKTFVVGWAVNLLQIN